jgi:hypothetical protein
VIFHAHSTILEGCRSSYIQTMMGGEWKEANDPVINWASVDTELWSSFYDSSTLETVESQSHRQAARCRSLQVATTSLGSSSTHRTWALRPPRMRHNPAGGRQITDYARCSGSCSNKSSLCPRGLQSEQEEERNEEMDEVGQL